MKKEKKIKNLEEKIDVLTLENSIDELNQLQKECEKETKGQTSLISNYNFLVDLIYKKKRSEVSLEIKEKLASILDEQFYLTSCTVKSDYSLDVKKQSLELVELMNGYLHEPYLCRYHYLLEDARKEIVRLELIEENKAKALVVINMIDDIKNPVSLAEAEYINSVYDAYLDLDSEAKEYVTNYDDLVNALNTLDDLKAALAVDEEIIELKTDFTLDDKEAILEVYHDYQDLTERQKEYLQNAAILFTMLDDLEKLEKQTKDNHQAMLFDKQIEITYESVFDDDIDNTIKIDSFKCLESMYNLLTDAQILLLENMDEYEEIKAEMINVNKRVEDTLEAKRLYDDINTLPININIDMEGNIREMLERYNGLKYQDLVTNSQVLFDNEKIINSLKKANHVDALINEINDYHNEYEIQEAREAYSLLDQEEKGFVMYYSSLKHYEVEALKYNERIKNARKLNDDILKLKLNEPLANLLNYKAKYESLGDEKELVSNYYLLEEAIERARTIEDALKLKERIDDLLLEESLEDLEYIEDIYFDYECLCNEAKELVTNISVLDEYLIVLNKRMNEVNDVINQIDRIDTVMIDEGDDIANARTAYELLYDDQKALVTNYQLLLEAEKEFMRIQSLSENINLAKSYLDEQIINLEELIDDPFVDKEKKREYYALVYQMYQNMTIEQKKNVKLASRLDDIGNKI